MTLNFSEERIELQPFILYKLYNMELLFTLKANLFGTSEAGMKDDKSPL